MSDVKNNLSESPEEKLIKSKKRVRKHGEVFTPKHIVKKMLDLPSINESCENLTKTFFEPGAGHGAFLVEILTRKLKMVEREYNDTIVGYENYSLLALSTLYGIELLEDNTRSCSMALFKVYYDAYNKQLKKHNKKPKPSVIESARTIIAKNIVQGDFLTKLNLAGNPVIFSEWEAINLNQNPTQLVVQRTEYTLEEVEAGIKKIAGSVVDPKEEKGQLTFSFKADDTEEDPENVELRYIPCQIATVFREEQEEVE